MRGAYVLWRRQLIRYVRSRWRMVGALGQPILFLVALGFGFGPIYAKAGGGDFIQFLAPGIIAMTVLFTAVFSGMETIWDRQIGFLKETLVAPVSRFEIMLGKTLGGATISLFQGVIVFLITLLVGFRPENWSMLIIAFIFMFLIGMMFTAFGVAIACNMEDMQAFPIILNFMIMPLFFLSGALYPLEGLSRTLTIISSFNPLTYGVDGLRHALTGISYIGFGLDFLVVLAITLILFLIGSYMFSKVQV